MRAGSAFLRDLARDADRLSAMEVCTSFWTPLDLTIIPAWSSVVKFGRVRRLWCVAHPLMVCQRSCLQAVEQELTLAPAGEVSVFTEAQVPQ